MNYSKQQAHKIRVKNKKKRESKKCSIDYKSKPMKKIIDKINEIKNATF